MDEDEEETPILENIIRSRLLEITKRIDLYKTEAETYCDEGSDTSDRDTVQMAQICASKLESTIRRFTSELNEYFKIARRPSADEISEMSNIQLNGEEMLAELKCRFDKRNIENRNVGQNRIFSAKLPTLTLPEFNGDFLAWSEYFDIFKSNIHDRAIPDVDKLLYLKSTLKGEPRRIIDGLETTNNNYTVAIQILKDRYGKQSQIIDAHYSALSKVKSAGESISECRVVLNEIERHLRVLESLGENTNHNHLRFLITEKFPENIVYEMKIKMKEDTVEEMRKQLEIIISAREEANRIRQEKGGTAKDTHMVETQHTVYNNRQQGRNMSRNYNDNFKRVNITREENKTRKRLPSPIPSGSRQNNMSRKRNYEQSQNRNKDQKGGSKEVIERKRRKLACIFCKKDHYADQCQEYRTVKERKARLKNRCFGCLSEGYISRLCRKEVKCVHCRSRGHHRSLCPEKFKEKTDRALTAINDYELTILQTAIVIVKNEKDHRKEIKCRLLLDSGSQRSYVTRQISRDLNLSVVEENKLSIFGFASKTPQDYDSNRVKIQMVTRTNKNITLYANEVPIISKGITSPNVNSEKLRNKILADDGSLGERIDILIGNDYYLDLISTEKIRLKDNLFLINTEFGWIISGRIHTKENENTLSVITYCQTHDPNCVYFTEPDLPLKNMDITFLWALESIGITDNPKATREEEAVKHFNETIEYKNGRYRVKWPWIQYPPEMPTNFGLAYGRLKGLLQRLKTDLLEEYTNILKEQLEEGIIEIINPEENTYIQKLPPIHYLPHHMVKQEGKKGRIVYDASGKLKEKKSLNECMYKGPSMIGDLVALLIQFRIHKVAITADVEKAFLQIELQTEDRDVTRFLWIKDTQKPLSMDNVIHMRFCRVPFGIIASPFILTATLKYHFSQKAPELVPKIVDKCYVDNLITGTNSTGEAIQLYERTQRLFNSISMNMRDWISNDRDFVQSIPSNHKAKETEKTKILGLVWNVKKDTLKLNIKSELFDKEHVKQPQNKRKILSTIASIYDPSGICSPLILPIKLLLQQLWEMKIKWDTTLPEDLQRKWEDLVYNLKDIEQIEIPRFMGITGNSENTTYELHGFSDASKQAYGTVVYLIAACEGKRNTAFVMAKSKVTPKQERENLRMPRLELLGCYLGSKIITYIKNAIEIPISGEYLWTDSQIVLCWISSNKLLPPFIGKRINAIKENKRLELRYINSAINPADLATRPDLWKKKKSLWLNGPEFLNYEKDKWPNDTLLQTSLSGQGPSDTTNLMEIDERIPNMTHQEKEDEDRASKDLDKMKTIEIL